MTGSGQPPSPDRLSELLAGGPDEEVVACLDRFEEADADARKRALGAVRGWAETEPSVADGFAESLATFLTDDDRTVRLRTAKSFVALARTEPTVVLPAVESIAARLADDGEFYYVRARCAEALGYVALDHPETVSDPATLADLRVGLSFDEPEVKEKLAKALECVALGDPDRLRHQVSSLAEHADDERELVRYHLCTALVAVGCEHPGTLSEADDALRERLADENPYVRGRAAEALGILGRSRDSASSIPELDEVDVGDDAPAFLTDRVRFARGPIEGEEQSEASPDRPGTVDSIRDGTEEIVEEITTPEEGTCPHCGLDLPEDGPPTCPRCGAPR